MFGKALEALGYKRIVQKKPWAEASISKRDALVDRLLDVLATAPGADIECVTYDVLRVCQLVLVESYGFSGVFILHGGADENLAKRIEELGFKRLGEAEWAEHGPTIAAIAKGGQERFSGVVVSEPGIDDTVQLCYFDGKTWSVRLWRIVAEYESRLRCEDPERYESWLDATVFLVANGTLFADGE